MATVTDAIERRAYERVVADGSVEVRADTTTATGLVLDLSEGGLRCLLHEPLPIRVDTSVDVVLSLGSASQSLTGTVVWEKSTDAGHEIGIQFRDASTHALSLVREAVDAAR